MKYIYHNIYDVFQIHLEYILNIISVYRTLYFWEYEFSMSDAGIYLCVFIK